jgi:uncharacterized protein YbaP (TraB family)
MLFVIIFFQMIGVETNKFFSYHYTKKAQYSMRLLHILILSLTFTLTTFANSAIKNPFLWEVTKDKEHFYLFGTMHLSDPDLQVLPLELKNIIKSSDTVYTEIPMDFSTQLKAVRYILRKDNKTLKEILPQKLYSDSEAYVKRVNPSLSLMPFEKMKIWALASTLTSLEHQLKYPTLKAIDKVIYDYAQNQKIKVAGIETLEEQFGLMDSFSLEEQIITLESTLMYLNGSRDFVDELKQHYLSGDGKKVMKFIESTMFQIPKYQKLEEKFMQRMLYDRNLNMAKRIDRVIKKNSQKQYLFAFGVMHFLGKKSVIEYLEEYGYSVKRL